MGDFGGFGNQVNAERAHRIADGTASEWAKRSARLLMMRLQARANDHPEGVTASVIEEVMHKEVRANCLLALETYSIETGMSEESPDA